ncbi:MAG: DEAD/DEAH box helicase, partial [Firmicutes bacterium]|nr:DEAD/DEAH box helicase [Bacillota bacterium]
MEYLNKFISIETDIDGVTGLTDELFNYYLSGILKEKKQNVLFLTSSLFEANKFFQMISDYTKDVLLFPMDDFLTSEALAISPEFEITRLETMLQVLDEKPKIIVTNLMGYLRYLPTKEAFQQSFLKLQSGKDYQMKELVEKLYQMGYQRETIVNKTGEIAVRGFVVDVFPMGQTNPIRIEFWGDTIDSIRTFHVDNQHTLNKIHEITISPNSEFLTSKEVEEENKKQKNLPNYEKVSSIIDYLQNPLVVFGDYSQLKASYETLLDEIYHYNVSLSLPGDTAYMHDFYQIESKIKQKFYYMGLENISEHLNIKNYQSYDISELRGSIEELKTYFKELLKQGKTIILALKDRYQVNHVIEDFELEEMLFVDWDHIIENKINLINYPLTKGFQIGNCVVISERELFHKKHDSFKYKTNFKFGTKIRDINKLNVGDYIVHNIHGIGRYMGMTTLVKNGLKKDYLMVEYKGGDKLYIPVEKIEFISKYSSSEGSIPKLNKLGSSEWAKTKMRVRKKIEDIAGKLLKLYATREAIEGFSYEKDDENQIAFEKDFPFEETLDQLKVTEEIKKDMESIHPMDRLLCGDVGFGKTEVAFRAMFKAVLSHKQVAFLCPTTILSKQHYQNALSRFSNFPVEIALLNRFATTKQVKQILEDLKTGKIDILIGTHRILSNDVEFKDLGLLVIDEEQRFGVKHKEKIKEYRNTIDVLTLSATPIPRTLQLSMAGVRSLSLIETAPVNRYPVQTYVVGYNKPLLKDAIYKELSRNGQVFILYNHIDDMSSKVHEIERFVPDARVISAHGRMNKKELEDVM